MCFFYLKDVNLQRCKTHEQYYKTCATEDVMIIYFINKYKLT